MLVAPYTSDLRSVKVVPSTLWICCNHVRMGRHPSRRHASPDDAPIGRRIRARRRELGLTQANLASPEYTKSFISQLESGLADPSLDSLRFLSRRLETSLSMIAGDPADQRLAAVEGLLQWGREAMRTREANLARRVLETAVEMAAAVGPGGHHADAQLLLAELETARGDLARAAQILTQITEPAARPGTLVAARTSLAAGDLALRRGEPGTAGSSFREALGRLGKGARHPELRARALLGLAAAMQKTGDLRQARRRAEAAGRLATGAHLPELRGRAEVVVGQVALAAGAYDEARRLLRSACAILEVADDPRTQADALIHLGRAALAAGDPDEALAAARQALAAAAALGDEAAAARASGVAGRALFRRNEIQEGVTQMHAAVLSLERLGDVEALVEVAADLAGYYRSRGETPAW
jgi:transcriptional regulator with XRE-family HTH domain